MSFLSAPLLVAFLASLAATVSFGVATRMLLRSRPESVTLAIDPLAVSARQLERWHQAYDDAVLAGVDRDDAIAVADKAQSHERLLEKQEATRGIAEAYGRKKKRGVMVNNYARPRPDLSHFQVFGPAFDVPGPGGLPPARPHAPDTGMQVRGLVAVPAETEDEMLAAFTKAMVDSMRMPITGGPSAAAPLIVSSGHSLEAAQRLSGSAIRRCVSATRASSDFTPYYNLLMAYGDKPLAPPSDPSNRSTR